MTTVVSAVVDKLRHAEEVLNAKESSRVSLYCLRVADGLFGLPFASVSDDLALKAATEICPTANLYCIGSFRGYDGRLSPESPRLVLANKVVNA